MNSYSLDTNILLRLIEKTSFQHPTVLQALTQIATKKRFLIYCHAERH